MIHLQGVEKRYGNFQALYPLNLHVQKGEVFGFLGPNGAGKTTTIRILSGVLVPTNGDVKINGIDIVSNPVESKKHVGYIPDRPYLYDKLTAREFLHFVGDIYEMEKDEIIQKGDALLAENDLSARADELIEAYSHGMKQRLVLSAALLHSPSLLIVDEPMVGLDPHGAKRIKEQFRKIADEGRTVFLSTHSLDVAQEVCDRVGILFRGQLVAMGTVDEILALSKDRDGDLDLEKVFLQITEEQLDTQGAIDHRKGNM
jgi:ABC-2 type transport system ATP-binding protein